MNFIKPYVKIVDLTNRYACVAIYEPNPFRPEALAGAIKQSNKQSDQMITLGNTVSDENWCWVYYDWCGNPVGTSMEAPEGRLTYKLIPEDFEWMGPENAERYCEYLNKEPNQKMKEEWYAQHGGRYDK